MDCAGRLSLILILSVSVLGFITNTVSSQSILQILPGNRKICKDDVVWCESWRFTVETNDAGVWQTVPERCAEFVKEYMTGDRYPSDSKAVAEKSLSYAVTVEIAGDGKDAWVFDIDETLLSNLPYYALYGYGTEAYDETSFDEWEDMAEAPALPESLKLYNSLQKLGFKLFLLTGRTESKRNVTEKNLVYAGYKNWERLILRGTSDSDKLAIVYKSEKRMELQLEGYRLHGCSGDQWSDLMGNPMSKRLFKLPNPMYYIA